MIMPLFWASFALLCVSFYLWMRAEPPYVEETAPHWTDTCF